MLIYFFLIIWKPSDTIKCTMKESRCTFKFRFLFLLGEMKMDLSYFYNTKIKPANKVKSGWKMYSVINKGRGGRCGREAVIVAQF